LNDVAKKYESSGEIIPVVGDITTKDGIAKIVEQIQSKSPNGINVLYVHSTTLGEANDVGLTMLVLPEKDLERDTKRARTWRNTASNC
jgi:hypothetical protein